jgi:hypothetical protein
MRTRFFLEMQVIINSLATHFADLVNRLVFPDGYFLSGHVELLRGGQMATAELNQSARSR